MGAPGVIGFVMAKKARHPEAVYKALHRMLYGGLIQRSKDRSLRARLLGEYFAVATEFLSPDLKVEAARLRPEAYWATNKTVLELLASAEEQIDFDTTELWSLLYAPALYYQDAETEIARGELNFEQDEMPTVGEMLEMAQLGARHLCARQQPNGLQRQQLRFALEALPNLPQRLVTEYRKFGMVSAEQVHLGG